MRVLLLQLDGKWPNVALMRIAAHHRALGDSIDFRNARTLGAVGRELFDAHDRIYASLLFGWSAAIARRLLEVRPDAIVGGTGWDEEVGHITEIEKQGITTIAQDYSIYPKTTVSIGYSMRGCRLGKVPEKSPCKSFCSVPRREGGPREEQTIGEIWRGEKYPRTIVLLDNDFFGQKAWRERLDEIRDGGFAVSFNQGINARFLNEESAAAIASVNYRDDNFRDRRIYTAWDNQLDEKRVFEGLRALVKAGIKPSAIMVYMIIGLWPGETHEMRDYRRRRLREFGARPFPMLYRPSPHYEIDPELRLFQRWVLARSADKVLSWEEWCRHKGSPRRAVAAFKRRSLPVLPGFEKECG